MPYTFIRPPHEYPFCVALSFVDEHRPYARVLAEVLGDAIQKAELFPGKKENFVFCETEGQGERLEDIGRRYPHLAVLIVPIFSEQYGAIGGAAAEWKYIEPLTRSSGRLLRVYGIKVSSKQLDNPKDYSGKPYANSNNLFIRAQECKPLQIAEQLVEHLRKLLGTWTVKAPIPKICGDRLVNSRFELSQTPYDLAHWHDHIYASMAGPIPFARLQGYREQAVKNGSHITVFSTEAVKETPIRSENGNSEAARINTRRARELDLRKFEEIHEALKCLGDPRCNIFYDDWWNSRVNEIRRGLQSKCAEISGFGWLRVRWWAVDHHEISLLCYAAGQETVTMNVLLFSGTFGECFLALAEVASGADFAGRQRRKRYLIASDSPTTMKQAAFQGVSKFFEKPLTDDLNESKAGLRNKLIRIVAEEIFRI